LSGPIKKGTMPEFAPISRRTRFYIVGATLLALFLGALDTLVMSAAMPTIVSELGGLHLYSWVFSAYLLSRAVALPIFGKLADLLSNRILYTAAILIFLAGSVGAGFSQNMIQLSLMRALQGIGGGGIFALVYIVLADISGPEKRGKMMSVASFVWGLASVLGPTFGGFMVTCFSWRWIFFINVPLGALSLIGVILFLRETREKREQVAIDYQGALTLAIAVLTLLVTFMLGGRDYSWGSPVIIGLLLLSIGAGILFCRIEKQAREPILSLSFFSSRDFTLGNSAVFFSSFAIFSISAFAPLFIQGTLGQSPEQLGIAMVSLSLGWSVGAIGCGQMVDRFGGRIFALAGAFMLVAGSIITVGFSPATSLITCAVSLGLTGAGMGFVSIATLIIVQKGVGEAHLGVATSTHQFTRTLGGTIGVGICGNIATIRFAENMDKMIQGGLVRDLPPRVADLT